VSQFAVNSARPPGQKPATRPATTPCWPQYADNPRSTPVGTRPGRCSDRPAYAVALTRDSSGRNGSPDRTASGAGERHLLFQESKADPRSGVIQAPIWALFHPKTNAVQSGKMCGENFAARVVAPWFSVQLDFPSCTGADFAGLRYRSYRVCGGTDPPLSPECS